MVVIVVDLMLIQNIVQNVFAMNKQDFIQKWFAVPLCMYSEFILIHSGKNRKFCRVGITKVACNCIAVLSQFYWDKWLWNIGRVLKGEKTQQNMLHISCQKSKDDKTKISQNTTINLEMVRTYSKSNFFDRSTCSKQSKESLFSAK